MTSKARQLADLGGDTANLEDISSAYSSGALSSRNRIINGAMTIDQRNAGASVTANSGYKIDRWEVEASQSSKLSIQQQTSVVPTGFTYAAAFTSLSAYSVGSSDTFSYRHIVEGFNVADLGWGAAGAQTVTLSFWVRSSLTGNFGGAFANGDNNRSYPFSYSISAANTWEQKTVTVPGDTTGTWGKTNGRGIAVRFGLGAGATFSGTANAWVGSDIRTVTGAVSVVGTSGATFYLTGVQLEAGDTATPFEHRSYGQELALCMRYFQQLGGNSATIHAHTLWLYSTLNGSSYLFFPTPMRASPTCGVVGTPQNVSGGSVGSDKWAIFYNGAWRGCNFIALNTQSQTGVRLDADSINSMAGGGAAGLYGGDQCNLIFSAEL
jgi:hypothetical protein